ncbi:MAG TPA: phage tail sheath C-terminal domain-containing protein, partial [Acetobacteraceae bacterium]|nr:phage tail sheath C-terminal domain-containing protein [Acetobacteraceae bacterium]
ATAPAPLPLTIKVFANGGAIPQTVAGLAARVEQTINGSLAVNWPGAAVRCAAVDAGGGNLAIRIVGFLPGHNDAVLSIAAPAGPLKDAATPLGLAALANTNVAHYTLGTGNAFGAQTASALGTDGTGLPGATQLVGDEISFTGIYALRKVDLFNLLSIPDATRAAPGNPNALDPAIGNSNNVYGPAISLCRESRAMLLVDPPPSVRDVSSAVDWKTTGLTVHQENGAAYFPRLILPDPANKFQPRKFAPSGVVAGLYSRIDGTRGVWKAPAGTEATLTGVQGVVYKLSDPENGVLNPLGLNCFRIFPIYGAVAWGARTLVGADAEANQWKYVPVRRLALYIEESLYRGTKWAVFEPNDEPLWSQLRLNIGSFMHDLFRRGAFQGSTPKDAYLVKCDKDTTTQNDIDRGVVNVLVGFAPLKPAEFVIIQIQQLAGQLQT